MLTSRNNFRSGGGVKLEPDFEEAGVGRELANERECPVAVRNIEGDDNSFAWFNCSGLPVHALPLRVAGTYAAFRAGEDQFIAQDSASA